LSNALKSRLERLACPGTLADGTPCRIISLAHVRQLADEAGVSGRTIEITSLERGVIPERYLRNFTSLSADDQIQLLKSSVCIVGLGGLGGLVTDTLARLGIGRLSLVDGDVFEGHNLNRQLLSSYDGIGASKAQAAAKRVTTINPGLEVNAIAAYLAPANAADIINTSHLVVDCLDNIRSRFTLASAARQAVIPMVSAAVAGLAGHITTIFPEDRGLEEIYGPPDRLPADKGEELRLGCLAPGVNLMASLECAEVLKVLLGKDNTLQNKLLMVDLTDYTFDVLQL